MLYFPKINGYLKILKNFTFINFGEYIKSARKKLYSKLCEEQNFRKVVESFYIFLTTSDEVGKYVEMMQSNSSDNCVHHDNIGTLNLFWSRIKTD